MAVRDAAPGRCIVYEFASSDWVADQVAAAADCGADFVQILGLSNRPRLEHAISAARSHDLGVIVGCPLDKSYLGWLEETSELGPDGIAVIRNIDSSFSGVKIRGRVRSIAKRTSTPIAMSGGFSLRDVSQTSATPWNILIVGRAVINSMDAQRTMSELASAVTALKAPER